MNRDDYFRHEERSLAALHARVQAATDADEGLLVRTDAGGPAHELPGRLVELVHAEGKLVIGAGRDAREALEDAQAWLDSRVAVRRCGRAA